MSRYTGPSWKVSRRLGYSTLETGRELAKRDYAPGAHGNDRRKKKSEYGLQLAEKQKLRMTYGVSERQFQRLYIMAKKEHGVTGLNFMRILETRLDNLVFRLGFARTRRGAMSIRYPKFTKRSFGICSLDADDSFQCIIWFSNRRQQFIPRSKNRR